MSATGACLPPPPSPTHAKRDISGFVRSMRLTFVQSSRRILARIGLLGEWRPAGWYSRKSRRVNEASSLAVVEQSLSVSQRWPIQCIWFCSWVMRARASSCCGELDKLLWALCASARTQSKEAKDLCARCSRSTAGGNGKLLFQRPGAPAPTQSRARAVELGAADSRMRELARGEGCAREHSSSRVPPAARGPRPVATVSYCSRDLGRQPLHNQGHVL